MKIKSLVIMTILLTSTIWSQAQQINPVPDYVFRNQMSVGRNAVTDTAAYFSIGPRYGATRGMMPPMVVDTASFSANKRNGLLIFSVQKNKFLYWDSVGVKWAEMAGTGGTAISSGDTAAMLLPYVRHAGYGLTKSGQSFLVDTLNISTRAWRQKGIDSLANLRKFDSSIATNYVSKFTDVNTLGNSLIFDNGTLVTVGTGLTWDNTNKRILIQRGTGLASPNKLFTVSTDLSNTEIAMYNYAANSSTRNWSLVSNFSAFGDFAFLQSDSAGGDPNAFNNERIYIAPSGNVIINGRTDASYKFDVIGSLRTTTGATFATSSGEVLIATTTDNGDFKLQVNGNSEIRGNIRTSAPPGGTANDWRLGTVATVSPTSPNRTIEVSIGGTIYYIAAKTTND